MKLIQPTTIDGTGYCLTGSLQRTPYVIKSGALASFDGSFVTVDYDFTFAPIHGTYEFGVGCGTGVSLEFEAGEIGASAEYNVDVDVYAGGVLFESFNLSGDGAPSFYTVNIPIENVGCGSVKVDFFNLLEATYVFSSGQVVN